jgi:pimeloyl-ACP methyl ester carboxylesterase
MATDKVNGVLLRYELSGAGEVPLVLVHGSWGSHRNWDLVVRRLAESVRVLTYDRRGHSESERPTGQGSICEDVDDLAGLIEHLELAPAYVAGDSRGAAITLRLTGERPDLLRGVIAHEPPLFSLLADDPAIAPLLEGALKRVRAVTERIESGDHAGAAEEFCEVALGPGAWAQLPRAIQERMIENAPTFLDEENDPEAGALEVGSIEAFRRPTLLTTGDRSPPMFAPVIAKLAEALPRAETLTYSGAGHIPHATHPKAYIEATTAFIRRHEA